MQYFHPKHHGNTQLSFPVVYSRNISKNYENMKLILELINYKQHSCRICCDLKILNGVKNVSQVTNVFFMFLEGDISRM